MGPRVQTGPEGAGEEPGPLAPAPIPERLFYDGTCATDARKDKPECKAVTAFKAEFDPFDPVESARVNQALKDFGFCMLLGQLTFNTAQATIDSYCDGPQPTFARAPVPKLEYVHKNPEVKGIFYRPRVPHNYYLFVKKNPLKRHGRFATAGGWELQKTTPVEMENISPVLSVGIERAAFTERQTVLAFDEGELKNVCIFKKSEFVEAVQIPLQVAQSVVALPANIVQVKIWDSNSDAALIQAQNKVLRAQQGLLQQQYNVKADEVPASGVGEIKKAKAPTSASPGFTPFEIGQQIEPTPYASLTEAWRSICRDNKGDEVPAIVSAAGN